MTLSIWACAFAWISGYTIVARKNERVAETVYRCGNIRSCPHGT